MAAIKLASNLVPFSRLTDRFVPDGYRDGYDFSTQLAMLARVDGIQGVALGWPSQFRDGAALGRQLDDLGLRLATVEPAIYSERRFTRGALSSSDATVRRAAIDIVKGTADQGLAAGAADMNLWLAQDGFDYVLGTHYPDAWNYLMDSLEQVAQHTPALPISIEYKCKEPRANTYVGNCGRALLIAARIGRPHVGITLDIGHALAALENPAECAALAMREGLLRQVHLNDNYREWDLDLIPGAANPWDLIEFMYWVRKLGYDGWFCVDVFPYREDGTEALSRTVQAVGRACRAADALETAGVEELLKAGRHLEAIGLLWAMVGPDGDG